MNYLRTRLRLANGSDEGMTLIEVVVALFILAVLATASLGVYISGVNTSSAHQRREIAVTIASQQLEAVSVVASSSLYDGRTAAAVTALRSANDLVPGVKQTYRTSGAAAATPLVPLTSPAITLSGTTFSVSTLIGTCFQAKIGGDCTATAGAPPVQPATPAGKAVLSRVTVVVRWSAGAGCKPVACMYHASTLVDGNGDLRWNSHG